jgi:hypothetical protein
MRGELEIGLPAFVMRGAEVRMAEDREALAADSGGRERRLRTRGLADVHDARLGGRSLDRGPDRLAPQRVDDEGRTVAAASVPQSCGQVLGVEGDGFIGAQVERSPESVLVATHCDDPFCTQYPGSLNRHRPDRAGRPENEHPITGSHRSPYGHRHPTGDARYSAGGGDVVLELGGHRNCKLRRKIGALDEKAVSCGAPTLSEEVQTLPVASSNGFTAWHVGQRWMTTVEAPGGDGEVEGIERDGEDLHLSPTVDLDELGRLA